MKMKGIIKCTSYLLITFLLIFYSAGASSQTLYGITDGGILVTINTTTGATTEVGDIGISFNDDGRPTDLAYNPNTGLLYVCTSVAGGLGRMFSVDPSTAVSTHFGLWGQQSYAITYRYVDDLLYRLESSSSSNFISRWDAAGNLIDDLGFLQDVSVIQGLAVKPSDGTLFGVGDILPYGNSLFIIPTTGDAYSLITVTQIGLTGTNILALTFWPDGILWGSDGYDLLRIDPSNGNVQSRIPIGISVIVGLAVVANLTTGTVDVWMKDCPADIGDVPSVPAPPCDVAFKSPDIWIDNNQDMILDEPVYNEINKLKARIRNRGNGVAKDVSVKFYFRNNSTGLHFPEGAEYIGEDIVTVPPNSQALASVDWDILTPPTDGGHWCIGVVLKHPEDQLPISAPSTEDHNNIAMANIWYLSARAGENESMSFVMGTGGSGGWGLKPWPRDFRLEVVTNLPTGWNWDLEGATVDKPITLKLGEEREVKLKIHVADSAAPHSGGSIEIRQVDVITKQIVGGLSYNVYEDHFPPNPIEKLQTNIIDGYVQLSWEEVRREAKTGMRERVSYYEILRNGKAIAKAVVDQDQKQAGYQWKDSKILRGPVTYSIRVVDEGGNISQISPEVKVSNSWGLFNWMTWLLLGLVIVLMTLILKIRRPLST
jgi:hypothetical protein